MSETTKPLSSSRSVSAILLPTLATVAFVLCLPILANHVKSRNFAASVLIVWIVLENMFNLINPILWPTNDFEGWWNGAGFCDVVSKLRLAAYIGFISALVCIYRQLAVILDTEQITLGLTRAQRRRNIAIETALCFGLPVYLMIAHYIVQSGRYYVFAITGCVPILDSSWPSTVLVVIWPTIIWIVATVYCSVIIRRLIKYRSQVSSILSTSQSRCNQSQFARLFAMATALIVIFLPVAIYLLLQNSLYQGQHHSYSWNRIHEWKDQICFVPSSGLENFGRWIEVVTGFVVFVSLGLSRDGLLMYRRLSLKLGLDKMFLRTKAPAVLNSSENVRHLTEFESMSSCAGLNFHRCSDGSAPPILNTNSSPPNSISRPNNDVTPLQSSYSIDNTQTPAPNTLAIQQRFSSRPFKRSGFVSKHWDENICMAALAQKPPPARLRRTRSEALIRENRDIITVTREVEPNEMVEWV